MDEKEKNKPQERTISVERSRAKGRESYDNITDEIHDQSRFLAIMEMKWVDIMSSDFQIERRRDYRIGKKRRLLSRKGEPLWYVSDKKEFDRWMELYNNQQKSAELEDHTVTTNVEIKTTEIKIRTKASLDTLKGGIDSVVSRDSNTINKIYAEKNLPSLLAMINTKIKELDDERISQRKQGNRTEKKAVKWEIRVLKKLRDDVESTLKKSTEIEKARDLEDYIPRLIQTLWLQNNIELSENIKNMLRDKWIVTWNTNTTILNNWITGTQQLQNAVSNSCKPVNGVAADGIGRLLRNGWFSGDTADKAEKFTNNLGKGAILIWAWLFARNAVSSLWKWDYGKAGMYAAWLAWWVVFKDEIAWLLWWGTKWRAKIDAFLKYRWFSENETPTTSLSTPRPTYAYVNINSKQQALTHIKSVPRREALTPDQQIYQLESRGLIKKTNSNNQNTDIYSNTTNNNINNNQNTTNVPLDQAWLSDTAKQKIETLHPQKLQPLITELNLIANNNPAGKPYTIDVDTNDNILFTSYGQTTILNLNNMQIKAGNTWLPLSLENEWALIKTSNLVNRIISGNIWSSIWPGKARYTDKPFRAARLDTQVNISWINGGIYRADDTQYVPTTSMRHTEIITNVWDISKILDANENAFAQWLNNMAIWKIGSTKPNNTNTTIETSETWEITKEQLKLTQDILGWFQVKELCDIIWFSSTDINKQEYILKDIQILKSKLTAQGNISGLAALDKALASKGKVSLEKIFTTELVGSWLTKSVIEYYEANPTISKLVKEELEKQRILMDVARQKKKQKTNNSELTKEEIEQLKVGKDFIEFVKRAKEKWLSNWTRFIENGNVMIENTWKWFVSLWQFIDQHKYTPWLMLWKAYWYLLEWAIWTWTAVVWNVGSFFHWVFSHFWLI